MMPTALLVAHGTRNQRGVELIGRIAEQLAAELRVEVRVAFADVLGPTPAEALAELDGPAVLIPAFLASGYHVHHDVRGAVAADPRPDRWVTPALGPDARLARAAVRRLQESGWDGRAPVVLAAAGSSDRRAVADLRRAVGLLAATAGVPVRLGTIATGGPSVAEVVAELRAGGADRVAVSSYLLAPGLFQERLASAGADVVAEPLGTAPEVIGTLVHRYREITCGAGTSAAALPSRLSVR